MKAKFLLSAVLLTVFSLSILADNVPLQDARKVAANYIYEMSHQYGTGLDYNTVDFTDTYVKEVDGEAVYYAFNLENGFIIISADDVYTPVIGYSFEGSFRIDDAPENVRSFIKGFEDQILFIRDNNIQAEDNITAEWDRLRSDNIALLNANRGGRDVDPLLAVMWNQDNPYNAMCPVDPAGPGGHALVGCVATAMAQIMYYWRYPLTGTGQHCYYPGNLSYGQQCAYFGNTEYQWGGMINGIDSKNPFPNAELQYHCAVSVNMNFGPNGSGSQSHLVPGAVQSYFRYNNAQYLQKSSYSTSQWITILKNEIDLDHPLYYSGYSNDGGHAFVCDGYQGDNFHFNFGWSGSMNGYFSLSNVGGFNQGQACVRYFYPTEPDYPYHNTGTIVITDKTGSITDGSGPAEDYINNNTATWIIDPQTVEDSISSITLTFSEFETASGDMVRIYDGESTSDPLVAEFSGTNVPDPISTGNKMCIVFETDGSGTASGWYAEFMTSSPQWCSGLVEFTEPTGSFDDGSGDFYYQSGTTCMWIIEPEFATKITLYFDAFETEENADVLKVFDGTSLIATLSGSDLPQSIEAYSGSMFLAFSANQTVNMQGWEVSYEVDNVSVPENESIKGLAIYPNPASDQLRIGFIQEETQDYQIQLMTLTGIVAYEENGSHFSGAYNNTVDVSGFATGVYILRISNQQGTINRKVVIQ